MREGRRRTLVVGVFPDGGSALRLYLSLKARTKLIETMIPREIWGGMDERR